MPLARLSPEPIAGEPLLLVVDETLTVRSSNAAAVYSLGPHAAAKGRLKGARCPDTLLALIHTAFETLATARGRIEMDQRAFAAAVSPVSDESVPLMLVQLEEVQPTGGESETAAAVECPVAHFAILDRQGKIVAVNRSWRDRAAAFPELAADQDVGGDYLAFCSALSSDCASFGEQAVAGIRDVLAGGLESFSMRYRCFAHGGLHWFRLSASPLSCHPGSEGGAVIAHYDISEQLRLSEANRGQVSVLQTWADAVFIVDVAGRLDWANEAFLQSHSPPLDRGQLAGIPLAESGGETLGEIIATCQRTGEPWSGQVSLPARGQGGDTSIVLQTVTPIPDASGEIGHFVIVQRDLAVERHDHAGIVYMTGRDEVTGLLERKSFVNLLRAEIGQHRVLGRSLAVLDVALERFKGARETFGERVGDVILLEIATRLERVLAGGGLTARLDGGEFAVLVAGCGTRGEVASLAERLLSALAPPVEVEGVPILIGANIGAAVFPYDGDGHEAILRGARLARQRARSEGARGYRLYDAALEAESAERASIERALSYALSTGGLAVAYQPQWSIATGHITGAESLLRWHPGARRGISTHRIISIAEESGLILPIGQWVARTALEQLRDWRRRLDPDFSLSVNLSAVQLNQQDVADLFIRAIVEHAIPPSLVKVELTESALVRNSPRVLASLTALHEAGVGLVLDDFGTGYSSLTYLQRFPIECVKIDCSFVGGIGVRTQDEAIVKGIILLAHSLGLTVVAEGVETAKQLEFLKSVECDAAQGFLVSPAVPAEEFEVLLLESRASGLPLR